MWYNKYMNKITPTQALANLYQAARLAKLSADEHALVNESAKVIQDILAPKEEINTAEK